MQTTATQTSPTPRARGHRAALLLGGALALAGPTGCIEQAPADAPRPDAGVSQGRFSQVVVTGSCPAATDPGLIEVNTLLLTGDPSEPALIPQTPLGRLVDPSRFEFRHLPEGVAEGLPGQAFIETLEGLDRTPLSLAPVTVDYAPTGAVDRPAGAPRLVIFLLDSAASLNGGAPTGDGAPQADQASDRNDQRITFFLELLDRLEGGQDALALVWFNDLPVLRVDYAAPTANRDVIREGLLNEVQFAEAGGTQVALALSATLDQIIAANPGRDPVVVLFTDGVEDVAGLDLSAVAARYRALRVPVIVIHLDRPPASPHPKGRLAALHDLACATGGDYLFLDHAGQLVAGTRDLVQLVHHRLRGAWRLTVRSDLPRLAPAGGLLSTVLGVALGAYRRSTTMERGPQRDDTRLWLRRP